MPDRLAISNAYGDQNRRLNDDESLVKRKNAVAGGTKPSNDASIENPFNTMPPEGYEYWKQANSQYQGQFKAQSGKNHQNVVAGNKTSMDNPLKIDPQGLNTYKYGEMQPKFLPARRNDNGSDKRMMEAEARDYLSGVYGVDFQQHKSSTNTYQPGY